MPKLFQKPMLLAAALLLLNMCVAQQGPTVLSGSFKSSNHSAKVYLSQTSRSEKVDSAVIQNDSFQFRLKIGKGDLYFLGYSTDSGDYAQDVYVQNGSNVHVTIGNYLERPTFTGSALAKEQDDFMKGVHALYMPIFMADEKLKQATDATAIAKITLQKKKLEAAVQDYYVAWVRTHKSSPYTVAMMYAHMQQAPAATVEKLFGELTEEAKRDNLVTQLIPYVIARRKSEEALPRDEKIGDFVLADTSGRPQSFYHLKGEDYVLLDIWASWCAPCRRSNPVIKNLLDEYSDQNFKVVSISADTDAAEWKKAIRADAMDWYHLSDLKGTDAGFMLEKYITAYPTYILISPQGKIVSKPYDIDRVAEDLARIFSEANKR